MHKTMSVDEALYHQGARAYWHRIFDPCPQLKQLLEHDSSNIVRQFIADCQQYQVNLNWNTHLILLYWLQQRYELNQHIFLECLSASAAAWASASLVHPGTKRAVFLDVKQALLVGAIRPSQFGEEVEVFQLEAEAFTMDLDEVNGHFWMALINDHQNWNIEDWEIIL